jgi:hypothetical protein
MLSGGLTNMIRRRDRIDKFYKEEKMLWEAIQAIDKLPAHLRLTEVLNILHRARTVLADYFDAWEEHPDSQTPPAVKVSSEVVDTALKTPPVGSGTVCPDFVKHADCVWFPEDICDCGDEACEKTVSPTDVRRLDGGSV